MLRTSELSILASPDKAPKGKGKRGAPPGPRDKNLRRRLKNASESERAAIRAAAAAKSERKKSIVWAEQRAAEERLRQEASQAKAAEMKLQLEQQKIVQEAERIVNFRRVQHCMRENGFPTMWSFLQAFFSSKDNQVSSVATGMVRDRFVELEDYLAERDPRGVREYSIQVVSNLIRMEAISLSQALRRDILSSVHKTLDDFDFDELQDTVEKSAPVLLSLLNETVMTPSKEDRLSQGKKVRRNHNLVCVYRSSVLYTNDVHSR
jgi:hypothetical protein